MHTFYLVARKQRFTYNRQNWQNIVSTIAHHQRRGRAPDSAHYRKMSRTLRVDELLQDGRRTLKKPSPAQDPSPPMPPARSPGGTQRDAAAICTARRTRLERRERPWRFPLVTLSRAFPTRHGFDGSLFHATSLAPHKTSRNLETPRKISPWDPKPTLALSSPNQGSPWDQP